MSASRLLALATALLALASVGLKLWLVMGEGNSPAAALWILARYFTILTNLFAALALGAHALTGRPLGAGLAGAFTSAILMVAIVYHTLLAETFVRFSGDWWADIGLHGIVPALCLLWWLAFGPTRGVTLRHTLIWCIWPAAYAAYAVIRGLIDGIYPYFFLDIGRFGTARVALNSLGLTLGFLLGSQILRYAGTALARWRTG